MSFSSTVYPPPLDRPSGPGHWWFRQVMIGKKTNTNINPSISFWAIAHVIERNDVHKGLYVEDSLADCPIHKEFNIDAKTKVIYEWVGPLPLPS